jgi:glucose/arabinose dehydrogenase
MKTTLSVLLIILCSFTFDSKNLSVNVKVLADNLVSPVGLVASPDATNRLFVIEQRGLVYILENEKLIDKPFLNIKEKLVKLRGWYDERGLLGMAFHPNFKENRKFYVYYSSNIPTSTADHIAVLAEYEADPNDPNKALNKERIILRVHQPEWNHNGGQLLFDSEGMLLLGLGDGGSGGDPHGTIGNAQDLTTWLGKIIRIDVDGKQPYQIPISNPKIAPNALPEIYAWGLRNPWRFSIDPITNRIFCGDVGQNKYEEVNIIQSGGNYGWRVREGTHVFNEKENASAKNKIFIDPIAEYSHDEGISITGGYVYRGKAIPALQGKYVFGDWRGVCMTLTEQSNGTWKRENLHVNYKDIDKLNINSFGVDAENELYIVAQKRGGPFQTNGVVLKIVE